MLWRTAVLYLLLYIRIKGGKEEMEGRYIGGRLRGQEEVKRAHLWDWIQSKMGETQAFPLVSAGQVIMNIYST